MKGLLLGLIIIIIGLVFLLAVQQQEIYNQTATALNWKVAYEIELTKPKVVKLYQNEVIEALLGTIDFNMNEYSKLSRLYWQTERERGEWAFKAQILEAMTGVKVDVWSEPIK